MPRAIARMHCRRCESAATLAVCGSGGSQNCKSATPRCLAAKGMALSATLNRRGRRMETDGCYTITIRLIPS
jgi:hypothetical protein